MPSTNKNIVVCHVAPVHTAEDGRVFRRACVSLAEEGYDTHLFAFSEKTTEHINLGVTIHPVYYKNRFQRFSIRRKIVDEIIKLKPDIIHVHDPEILGNVLSKSDDIPVIFDIHEHFLDILVDREWIPKIFRPIIKKLWDINEKYLIKKCHKLIVVTEGVAKRYTDLGYKPEIIHNYPSLDEINSVKPNKSDDFYCVYAGSINPDSGLESAIEAFVIIKSLGFKISFKIAGDADEKYAEKIKTLIKKNNLSDIVKYYGLIPRNDAIKLVSGASLGIMLYLPIRNNLVALPNKIFEYMAYSIPFIYSELPLVSQILDDKNVGIKVNPYDPEMIANEIIKLYKNKALCKQYGDNGNKMIKEIYNWEIEKEKLLDLYDNIKQRFYCFE
ncbi:MAG: glycosyltransferase family 4 protein [Armatimonadota bacterium]